MYLSSDNNYADRFTFDQGQRKDYIALEYMAGTDANGAEPVEYRVGDILSFLDGSSFVLEGKAKNSSRSYKVRIVKDSADDVFISNTRTGLTLIKVGKEWKDGGDSGYRPDEIKFRLYLNGTAYNSSEGRTVPDDVTIDGATIDHSDGTITVKPESGESWNFTINNLPMFSDSGMVNYYNIEEETIEEKNGVNYISKIEKVDSSADPNQQTQNITFNFSNTAVGTLDYSAYKKWNDKAINPDERPDIYFTLYRYLKSEKAEYYSDGKFIPEKLSPVTDCDDQVWTADPPAMSDGSQYDWKITVPNLPRFDADGNEYEYVFTEKINNNGRTVYGVYTQEESETEDGRQLFINTLHDYIKITGKKTWTGLSKYYRRNENLIESLPDPVITLYRVTQSRIDAYCDSSAADKASVLNELQYGAGSVKKYIDAKLITQVDSTILSSEGKVSYSFPTVNCQSALVNGDGELMLPKYDENGEKYIYFVRETLEGGIVEQLYTETNSNGTLSNIFRDDINRRTIKVTKTWNRGDIADNENKYPSVTYNLYRYKASEDPDSAAELYMTRKISSSQFSGSNGTAEVVFNDLLVFSPKGELYCYYITELSIAGYSVHYYNAEGYETEEQRISITDQPNNWNDEKAENVTSVKTENVYDKHGKVTLSGTKFWDDFSNLYGLRPSKDQFNLIIERYTDNEDGQNNMVSKGNIIYQTRPDPAGKIPQLSEVQSETEPYIEWKNTDPDSNLDIWEYTIHNLKQYAPNGRPYVYILSETIVSGYKKADDVSSESKSDNEDGRTFTMKQMKNSFDGVCEVRKNWFDGYNKYGLRPDSITVVLQKKTDTVDSDFVDVEFDSRMEGILPGDYTRPGDGKQLVSVNLTKENAIKNTRNDSSWSYTFKNLPLVDSEDHQISYRCREVMIGGVAVKADSAGSSNGSAGSYNNDHTDTENKTVIENTLKDTSLFIEKEWLYDNNDLYSSRPESIELKLQKKVTKQNGEKLEEFDWEDVTVDGKPTFTLKPDSSGNWTTELKDLPVAQIIKSKEGNDLIVYSLQYRAVEITDDNQIVQGAKNYRDITVYPDKPYNNSTQRNEITITNELIPGTVSVINVNKQWYSESTGAEAVLELQYRIKSSDPKNPKPWNSYKNELINCSSCSGNNLESFRWTNLPKYDREGNELEYQVIEHPVSGYETTLSKASNTWSFTNTELQSYTVKKIWKNADYAHKEGNNFTAEFKLQHSLNGIEWINTEVDSAGEKVEPIILQSDKENDEKSDTWNNLLKYDSNGTQIIYRAVETKINGKAVAENTNGDYIVTYSYDNGNSDPLFGGTETTATNRMICGFVNLSKAAAYLKPDITDSDIVLKDVVFDIYKEGDLYVSGIKTSDQGKLIRNSEDGTYGTEHRYLITGKYTIKERTTNSDFSVWKDGIVFNVGNTGGTTDTGEHGTAWIYTEKNSSGNGMKLSVEYRHGAADKNHLNETGDDICTPFSDAKKSYNIESRGVISFTKTDAGEELDVHEGAEGESSAYFGVYTSKECKEQVAGMIADSSDKTRFVLTDKKADNTTLNAKKGTIPYLRSYNGGFSLLSGEYYVKEIVAPAGYRLDRTVRKAVIDHLGNTPVDSSDIGALYGSNVAVIEGLNSNKWPNTPNKVTVFKTDQYGRKVKLKEGGYLKLSINNGKFPGGETDIYLYQNSTGNDSNVSYNAGNGSWTITGLLDIEKVYTLSEPPESVPDENIVASDIIFSVGQNGEMINITGADSKNDPLKTKGDDYSSYYRSDPDGNQIVMRDVSRYLNDVEIKKTDSVNGSPVPDISFKLYKYTDDPENAKVILTKNNEDAVLTTEADPLTTDSNGLIRLSYLDDAIINTDTGKAAKYGLDIGKYYFEELEMGASDKYRLVGRVYFDITRNENPVIGNYMSYAKVTFKNSDDVLYEQKNDTGIIPNDPVGKYPKKLKLIKTNDAGDKLSGAKFTLSYISVNNGQTGADTPETVNCITDTNGELRLESAPDKYPDISRKGTYTLKEILAPDYYMTPTVPELITFKVDSDNKITDIKGVSGHYSFTVSDGIVSGIKSNNGEHESLNLTVTNDKTIVNISKLNDIVSNTKTKNQKDLNGEPLNGAVLEIYEGTSASGTKLITLNDDSDCKNQDEPEWKLTGVLKERTVYTLHESSAPVGYMKADDIYFALYKTRPRGSETESILYVWSGSDAPDSFNESDPKWSKNDNLKNNTLTMVDEAIIVPVDMQKVVGDSTYAILPGAKFKVKAGEAELGTAVSDSNGWLVWESEPEKNGVVFTDSGKRAGSSDNLAGTKIIFQQNTPGYTFTEIYAPDNAYNKGDSWTVKITAENYAEYKSYPDKYIDIKAADGSADKTVNSLSARNNTPDASDLVNPQYRSTVTLHKYDADEEAVQKAIADTEFTLYRGSVSDENIYKKAYNGTELNNTGLFSTDANGDLSIEIREKGTYILKETKAATGYVPDADNSFTFTLQDKSTGEDKTAKNSDTVKQILLVLTKMVCRMKD